ncbi:MAG: hypothetical protein COB66_01440 [Coxiella sp. (in: Bacteria)]|nr:MAG: hypothetical protein COB66_01440 [Coxiella sp. (in: g-proteobacteria)]
MNHKDKNKGSAAKPNHLSAISDSLYYEVYPKIIASLEHFKAYNKETKILAHQFGNQSAERNLPVAQEVNNVLIIRGREIKIRDQLIAFISPKTEEGKLHRKFLGKAGIEDLGAVIALVSGRLDVIDSALVHTSQDTLH